MSRSYRKHIACHMCTGSNHDYYLHRRRNRRRKLNQEVISLIKHNSPEEFDEKYVGVAGMRQFENQWDETTDGHYGVDKTYYKLLKRNGYCNWLEKEVNRHLKSKHKRR